MVTFITQNGKTLYGYDESKNKLVDELKKKGWREATKAEIEKKFGKLQLQDEKPKAKKETADAAPLTEGQ